MQEVEGDLTMARGSEEVPIDDENVPSAIRTHIVAPALGMEFESYDDAFTYYNYYAKEMGFRVRVKNSGFKQNIKYRAVLCCSSQGFKRVKDVNNSRKETRTGCPAMIRIKLMDSERWRITEVILEHSHLYGEKMHQSMNKVDANTKRKATSNFNLGHTDELYKVVIDVGGAENPNSCAEEMQRSSNLSNQLNLKKGDAQAIYNYLCRMQLTNPNFFYLMDFDASGFIKNVFWADASSRAACGYFSDVIYLDNTCLANKYETPLVVLVGVNHHGQTSLLGCGLLAGETTESYTWLLRTWLKCTSGVIPQTIITDQCKDLQVAVTEVFPRSHHRYDTSRIMRRVPEKFGGLHNYHAIRKQLTKVIYESLKVNEFESAWRSLVQHFDIANHEWVQSLYEARAQWVPAYLKQTFFAGMLTERPTDALHTFFGKHVIRRTSLKEFLDKYELALYKKHQEEMLADKESRSSNPVLKTRCSFEQQLSEVYTKEIFRRFQVEVEEMHSCFSTTQIHIDGPYTIFLVKERVIGENNAREIRDYEVYYNGGLAEVVCICSCFNFNGYLCRHALCVLNFNGVKEIPQKYILARWKKDYKRLYVPGNGTRNVDPSDRVQWFNQLYKSAMRVVEEGVMSLDEYKVALKDLEGSLKRVHRVE